MFSSLSVIAYRYPAGERKEPSIAGFRSRKLKAVAACFIVASAAIAGKFAHQGLFAPSASNIASTAIISEENPKLVLRDGQQSQNPRRMINALTSPQVPQFPQAVKLKTSSAVGSDDSHTERVATQTATKVVTIESIDDLLSHLNAANAQNIDLDSIVDFVNSSFDAFDFLSSEYLSTEDAWLKAQLLSIIDNVNHKERDAFARELALSSDSAERAKAYEWLNRSEQSYKPEIYNAVIDAIHSEEDSAVLVELISMAELPDASLDADAHNRAMVRLQHLAGRSDEATASTALSKMAKVSQSDETLDFLHAAIDSGSPVMTKTAIESLENFSYPGDDVMRSLTLIMENPSAPQEIRAASVRSIVAFENYMAAVE